MCNIMFFFLLKKYFSHLDMGVVKKKVHHQSEEKNAQKNENDFAGN